VYAVANLARITLFSALVVLHFAPLAAYSQEKQEKEEKPAEPSSPPPKEESSVTEHTIKIDGQNISYKATAGMILLKNAKDEPTALVYSTSYVRSDVKDMSLRPIAFIYNGGPGSSSIWLHMGAFGPRRVVTVNADATPPAPYKLADNGSSLLDKADLVFIDPVGTGFSHAVGKAQNKDFYGVDPDVKSLAQFITTYISRNDRWNSPKFLIGESYGTFRSAVLSNYLQSENGVYLNGIVLVSSILQFGLMGDMTYISLLPTYAASAWYHKVLQDQPENLNAFVDEARRFAETEYASALMKGSRLSATEKANLAKKLARFTGLGEDYLLKANLRVNGGQFLAELQRSRGLTTGVYDARFSGLSGDLLSEYVGSDAQSDAITGAFTGAFNFYVRNELKFGQDKTYHTFDDHEGGGEWDTRHNDSARDLVQAMLKNPHMQVEAENGLYDVVTPFFATEYTMEHLGLPEKLQKNIHLKYYEAGHMMYVHEEDLIKLKNNVGSFIENASKQ
jgi:carboxypeptidase C (cathepsin A)